MKIFIALVLSFSVFQGVCGQEIPLTEEGINNSYLKVKPILRKYLRANQPDSVVLLGEQTWNSLSNILNVNTDQKVANAINDIRIELSYDLARAYAILKNKTKTLFYLRAFEKTGFKKYAFVTTNELFDFLSQENEFKSIVTALRERGDYLYILQKNKNYQTINTRSNIRFDYEPSTSKELQRLKKLFNLDSIAGKGDEMSKMISLMKWVHDIIKHDGTSLNPQQKNAIDIIQICRLENRGVNCRMMSTVLNEVYLAMGFYSRHLTCMPKDTADQDCHVVNMVFSKSKNKWIYVDPTFEVVLQDDKGNYLSPEEIRKRMVNEDTIMVSNTLNWNGKPYDGMFGSGPKGYLAYMTKNFFWFTCPIESKHSYETNHPRPHYIALVPLRFNNPDLKVPKTSVIEITHQPSVFWKSPLRK